MHKKNIKKTKNIFLSCLAMLKLMCVCVCNSLFGQVGLSYLIKHLLILNIFYKSEVILILFHTVTTTNKSEAAEDQISSVHVSSATNPLKCPSMKHI